LIAADSFIDTANPPGLSTGEDSFFPLAKRSKDLCSFVWLVANIEPARNADVFVDMFNAMFGISYFVLHADLHACMTTRKKDGGGWFPCLILNKAGAE
jgi:hypothetical protein